MRRRRAAASPPRGRVDATANQLGRALQDLAQSSAHICPLAEPFGDDVPHAGQHVIDAVEFLLRRDQAGSSRRQIGGGRVGLEHFTGQRFQAALPGRGGQRLLLGLVGQIQIFQPLAEVAARICSSQLRSQIPWDWIDLRMVCLRSARARSFPTFS